MLGRDLGTKAGIQWKKKYKDFAFIGFDLARKMEVLCDLRPHLCFFSTSFFGLSSSYSPINGSEVLSILGFL